MGEFAAQIRGYSYNQIVLCDLYGRGFRAVWTRARGVATHVFRTAQWNSRQRYIPAHVSKWLDDWLEERHAGEWPGKLL